MFSRRRRHQLSDRIASVSQYYWKSAFNTDANTLYQGRMPEAIQSATPDGSTYFEGWSTLTPERVAQVRWQEYSRVSDILNRALA